MPSRTRRARTDTPAGQHVADRHVATEAADDSRTMAVMGRRPHQPKQLDAGPFQAEVDSFRLHLAAEAKALRTIDAYTGAANWFAAAHLLAQTDKTRWEEVCRQDVQRWTVRLLGCYSIAYASIQFRALQQFFKWLAAEAGIPDPMAGLRQPAVKATAVPVFTTVELSRLEAACRGNSFAQRRDAAIIAIFRATGIRLSEMAGIRHDPDNPAGGDLDLQAREVKVRGKGGKDRTVKITHQAARAIDRYLRARAGHPQAWRPQLWLGVNGRGPLTAAGIYQMTARRGKDAGVAVHPHRFRHHFSHTWLDRGGAERDLMELNGWSSPQMLNRYGASARAARARRTYDRVMEDNT
jgi:site-specific recombinase XerD